MINLEALPDIEMTGGMTVRELIQKLLEQNLDEEIVIAQTRYNDQHGWTDLEGIDEIRKDKESNMLVIYSS